MNRKWRKSDFRYKAQKQILKKARTTIKLALEQKTLRMWEKPWLSEKSGRKLHIICQKLTKKLLRLYKDLCKAASALIV